MLPECFPLQELTLEAHVMKITDVEWNEGNRQRPPVMPPEDKSSNSLPFYTLRNRSFMLLSCMLLNLAETDAADLQDGLRDDFILATADCLKEMRVSDHPVASLIEKPNWRVGDLQAALVQSAGCLNIRRF